MIQIRVTMNSQSFNWFIPLVFYGSTSLLAPLVSGQDQHSDRDRICLQEALLAQEIYAKQNAELTKSLRQSNRELEKCREDYAQVYQSQVAIEQELGYLKLRATYLLDNSRQLDCGHTLTRYLSILEEIQSIHHEFQDELWDFRIYVDSILALHTEPINQAIQAILDARFQVLLNEWQRVNARLNFMTENRTASTHSLNACRIIAVNLDLNLVILDIGENHGVKPGILLNLQPNNDATIKVKLMEVRKQICGAEIIKGNANRLIPPLDAKIIKDTH